MIDMSEPVYAGFWRRFAANMADFVCISPLSFLNIFMSPRFRLFYLYFIIPSLLVWVWYYVYLVKRYGGTPGKLLLGLRIRNLDGSPVGYRTAFLRFSVDFAFSSLFLILWIFAMLNISDAEFYALERTSKFGLLSVAALSGVMPFWYNGMLKTWQIWIWGELIVMMTNRKRRAAHDFIAGTIVIKNR